MKTNQELYDELLLQDYDELKNMLFAMVLSCSVVFFCSTSIALSLLSTPTFQLPSIILFPN